MKITAQPPVRSPETVADKTPQKKTTSHQAATAKTEKQVKTPPKETVKKIGGGENQIKNSKTTPAKGSIINIKV